MTAETGVITTGAGQGVAEGRYQDPSFHDARGGISNPVLGMILFICSEVMFFSGLFAAYFSVRASSPLWPFLADESTPEGKALNEAFNLHAEPWFAAVLTVVLILSSFTCQMGIWAIRRDDRRGLVRAIGVTLALGILFLIGQAYDYSQLGFGISDTPFGTTFYTLTGFHGAHVFGGAVMLSVILYRGLAGQFSSRHHDAVEAVSLYWHFVDVVWIALFSTLYIL
jgi:cytochrome c oxidase subunit 3